MNIFCCYTKAHKPLLVDYFIPSMPNDINLSAISLDGIDGPGDFLSTEFIDCIRRKMQHIEQSIRDNRGSIIGWLDVDIVFFKNFRDAVLKFMEDENLDIAFQKEGFGPWDGEVNTGVIFMRCNERVLKFYQQVRRVMAENPDKNEQPVVNELLAQKPDLRWKMLPLSFRARSHGWPLDLSDAVLYHANVTTGSDGVGQKIRQFAEVNEIVPQARHQICVVSPEVIGPRRNSGIGTHTWHLLKMLARQPDCQVTLLLTAEIKVEKEGGWEAWFQNELGVRFVHLESQPHLYPWVGWFNQWFNIRSQQVYNFLRKEAFDIVHFQDLNGDGFVSHQARNTGLAFAKTAFTVTVNGPARWAREGMKQFPSGDPQGEVYEELLNFVESYPAKECDLLISPSQYAIDYVTQEADWALSLRQRICPYMLELPQPEKTATETTTKHSKVSTLVFFGRLETRKGIHLFLSALEILHRSKPSGDFPRKVVFIGNHAPTPLGPSEEVIPEFFATRLPGWEYKIESQWDQPDCIDFLCNNHDLLVVLPSISETLGYTAIECLGLGVNVIGANAGAFGEVFADPERLFENNPRAIAAKILEAADGKLPHPRSHYDSENSHKQWMKVHEDCLTIVADKNSKLCNTRQEQPLVSICLPHFNYGRYVGEQIESMAAQDYPNIEFILIDDGSTDPDSKRVFAEWKGKLKDDGRFRFLEQENCGLSNTRNRAATLAKGNYIVFCDADNISRPHMVSTFVRAITTSGADCVSCHFAKFRLGEDGKKIELDAYTPIGACIEAGLYVDPFGDANFIIKKSTFQALGGFRHVPFTASEDWEFLAELVLSGYHLEVVPTDLFQYREHSASNMRVSNYYDTRMRVIHPYLKRCTEPWMRHIISNAMGASESREEEKKKLGQDWLWFQNRIKELSAIEEKLQQEIVQKDGQINVAQIRQVETEKSLAEIQSQLMEAQQKVERLENNPLQRIWRKFQTKK